MKFEEFASTMISCWNEYIQMIAEIKSRGGIDFEDGIEKDFLYPSIIIFTNFGDYYSAETVGAISEPADLVFKTHKETSIGRYLGQFNDIQSGRAFFQFEEHHHKIQGLLLVQALDEGDYKNLINRFPKIESLNNRKGGMFVKTSPQGQVFSFGEKFISMSATNITIVNNQENLLRCKDILSIFIVKSSITEEQLLSEFDFSISSGMVIGVHQVVKGDERLSVVMQFKNIFLFPGLRETTIGEFIKLHPEFIYKAFDTKKFIYEPTLNWIEHDGTCEDTAINPDLLIQRKDGFYDIYDLKLPLLDKVSITKGERKRRGFISSVEDGINQLANYREYFSYPKNNEYAKNAYGIEIFNPKLVLIIGNEENYEISSVEQASRKLNNIEIINYDLISSLYLAS